MKRAAPLSHVRPAAAFTLIEMIGVLAIMAILASVLVPNVLRSLDRAAVDAEAKTLAALGDQVKLYLRKNGTMPSSVAPVTNIPATATDLVNLENGPSWSKDIGALADIAVYDIAVNKRNMRRVYLVDPASTPLQTPRVMILSSMRAGLALPAATDITTKAQFQTIWQTADKDVPAVTSWGKWSLWAAVTNSGEQLLIERINLLPIYYTALDQIPFTFKNSGPASVIIGYDQPVGSDGSVVVAPATSQQLQVYPRTHLDFYRTATRAPANLDYTYIVGTAGGTLSFEFNGTNWIPK